MRTEGGDMAPRCREPPGDWGPIGVIQNVVTYSCTCYARLPK